MEIEKLKVIKITQYYLLVKNKKEEVGSIYIAQVSNYLIKDLSELFKIGDYIYGQKYGKYKGVQSYSLKKGHFSKKVFQETGGGFLILKKYLEEFEKGN